MKWSRVRIPSGPHSQKPKNKMKAKTKSSAKKAKPSAKAKAKPSVKPNISGHILIPKHTKLSEKDKKGLFEKYKITFKELPKISPNDPAINDLELKQGDVIKIERKSQTAGNTVFYRSVK